jgi:putative transposase
MPTPLAKEAALMLRFLRHRLRPVAQRAIRAAARAFSRWCKPRPASPLVDTIADLARSKPQLVAENLLLRQQLIVLNRTGKRPHWTRADRALVVVLASKVQRWREALLPIRPGTVLRWHRAGLRIFWKAKSRASSQEPRIAPGTIALIKELAANNRLWGADRIRGELLKLGITVAKRTIQRHMRQARPSPPRGQTWATFLRNHAQDIWACDFVQLTDVWFRPLFAFVVTELGSRRIVHVGVTRVPTDAWVAQQLREATPFGAALKYLIRDNDAKYGPRFDTVAAGSGITVLRTPIRAPRANAICERLIGSLRRECLDHILVVSEAHLRRVLNEYAQYFNQSRPHQGIAQRVPEPGERANATVGTAAVVTAFPVLGGLHHAYRRAA